MQRHSVVALMLVCLSATSATAYTFVDANGNTVVSHKTGATARVGAAYVAQFQSYINDIEARGGVVRFMGGTRRGRCWSGGMHPCGRALDVCQTARGRVDPSCHLPPRRELASIAQAHGLFEGGQWCNSDYGHAQVGESAAPCGSQLIARHRTTITASARSSHHRRAVAVTNSTFDRLTASY